MRFIPRNCIQPQAVLARPILGASGEILLRDGVEMQPSYIRRLADLGISGAYVNDPISEDLDIVGALSDELRAYAVKNIFTVFTKAAQNNPDTRSTSILVMKTAEAIVEEILAQGDVMLNLFDMKVYDSYTYFHCVNVTVLSIVIGIGMNYSKNQLIDLAYGALLHDIGKIFIEGSIINKVAPLTPEEYVIIKKHPLNGYNYVKEKFYTNVPEIAAIGMLDHHERMDGSGYPSGKKNTQIVEVGRILAIADVYDALISDRPYRKGMFSVEAMEYVQGASETLFDFEMVNIFARKVALFPVGTCVSLSNGSIGLVMSNYEGFSQRPLLKIFKQDNKAVEPYFLDLSKEAFDTTIVSTVEI